MYHTVTASVSECILEPHMSHDMSPHSDM